MISIVFHFSGGVTGGRMHGGRALDQLGLIGGIADAFDLIGVAGALGDDQIATFRIGADHLAKKPGLPGSGGPAWNGSGCANGDSSHADPPQLISILPHAIG